MLDTQLPFGWTIILIVVDVLVWILILIIWEKIKVVGSLEWFLALIAKRKKPGKVINMKDVLDVKGVLQEPEPILFVQPLYEQKIKYAVLGQSEKKVIYTSMFFHFFLFYWRFPAIFKAWINHSIIICKISG
jgi:hypothetical protein